MTVGSSALGGVGALVCPRDVTPAVHAATNEIQS